MHIMHKNHLTHYTDHHWSSLLITAHHWSSQGTAISVTPLRPRRLNSALQFCLESCLRLPWAATTRGQSAEWLHSSTMFYTAYTGVANLELTLGGELKLAHQHPLPSSWPLAPNRFWISQIWKQTILWGRATPGLAETPWHHFANTPASQNTGWMTIAKPVAVTRV